MLYALRDSCNLSIYSNTTNEPVLFADYARTTSIDFTADSIYALNKTSKAVRFDKQREGTFKTEMEVFETKWIAMLFGTSLATGTIDVFKNEVIAVNAGGAAAADLSEAPKSGTLYVYKIESKGDTILGVEQVSGNPATAPNAYSLSTKTLTLNPTTFSSAGFVRCFYLVNQSKSHFNVDLTSFPGGYSIYADGIITGTNQVDVAVQYQLHNAKPKSNVSLTMDADNVTKLSIEWDLFGNTDGNMMSYVEV